MIEADRIVRRYGDFAAVDDVSFKIEQGEIVGLLGHNGAGKTTIMKMLTGFIEPSSGAIRVDGVDVQEDPLHVQAQMGYLPESLPIYPEMSVMDYLAYAAGLRGLDASTCVPRVIHDTQLEEKALDRIDTLSRGYKQRVGVAQAILHDPRFLILDEPSNGLDPGQTQHMRELIVKLSRTATVILSTHIMQEVNAVCDRAMILRAGKLVIDERLEDLRATSAVVLRTSADAPVDAALANLATGTKTGHGEWRIEPNGQTDAGIADLTRHLVEAGIPVHEIRPEVRDLETLFKEVNEDEGSEGGVADAA